MKLDGQLEKAQFENLSGNPTSAPLGRVYMDITDPTNGLPKFHDGTQWSALLKRNLTYTTVTTTAVIGADIELQRCDATSAAFATTLPAAASMAGKTVLIEKIDATFNAVTLTGNAAELIDGSNTLTLNTKGEYARVLSLGTSWTVLATGFYTGKTAFTPTGSWSSNTTYTGYWYRVGNRLFMEIHLALAGAPTSATLTVNLPTGTTVDTAQMLNTTAGLFPLGYANVFDTSATDNFIAIPYYGTNALITMKKDDGDGTVSAINATAPVTFASGDSLDIVVQGLPITNWRG